MKCFVNDSEMLFNDFEMLCVMILKGCLINDLELDFNDPPTLSERSSVLESFRLLLPEETALGR